MIIPRLILATAAAVAAFQAAAPGNHATAVSAVAPQAVAPAARDGWPWVPAGGFKDPYAVPTKVVSIPSRTPQARAAYDWPIKPFGHQHQVRAYLDDPRVLGSQRNFHIGIDIGCPGGTPVYAIEAGLARHGRNATVVAVQSADRTLSYWHIRPAVRDYTQLPRHTLVGWTLPNFNHVHLSERDRVGFVNPLRPGALGPFVDHTSPKTIRVSFRAGGDRRDPKSLRGTVDIVADSFDSIRDVSPHPWVVTPSLLRWRILKGSRVVVPWRNGPDFRGRVLTPSRFTSVYAAGTRPNHRGHPGYFSFYLAHGFDTASLADGRYRLEVAATDIRGNTGLSTFPITVAN